MTGREVLLVPHTGRKSNLESSALAAELLDAAGIGVRVLAPENTPALANHPTLSRFSRFPHSKASADHVELVLVLGGDGTFLRAADLAHAVDLPVLGINLGHVGFLAEWESDSLEEAIRRVINRDYHIEDRMTLDIVVRDRSLDITGRGWALNELSVENLDRRGVLDATLEVDGRPVSTFGCDGVLVSTPTGSTAYAFSAGGPVLWPELDAILVVPNNAHALFAKPLVVSPAVAVMDGFRSIQMPPGSRVEVVRGERPVRWVRLDHSTFTDRLVTKFRLPVAGWRGPGTSSESN